MKLFFGWYLVAATFILSFILCATGLGIFFKPILDEFGWSRTVLSSVSAISMLVFAALTPLIGRLIDRFGARIMLGFGIAAQTLSMVVNGLAANLAHIYIGRFLAEVKFNHAAQVLINHWFVRKRGLALGVLSSGVPLGTLILSPVSQFLINNWGWRETFFFWAGVTAVAGLPLLLLVRNRPQEKGLEPDGQPLPAVSASENLKEKRESAGYSLKDVLRRRSFWLLTFAHFFCGTGCGLLMTHTVIFATDLGYPALIGASFLSVQGGVSLPGVLITGHLSDRLPRALVLAGTHFIRFLSFVILAVSVVLAGGNLGLLFLGMVFFGFGWFTTAPLVAGLVADLFGYLRMGTILGIVMASHSVGAALGTYAGGRSFQLSGSYFPVFTAQCILEFLAAVFVFGIARKTTRKPVATGL